MSTTKKKAEAHVLSQTPVQVDPWVPAQSWSYYQQVAQILRIRSLTERAQLHPRAGACFINSLWADHALTLAAQGAALTLAGQGAEDKAYAWIMDGCRRLYQRDDVTLDEVLEALPPLGYDRESSILGAMRYSLITALHRSIPAFQSLDPSIACKQIEQTIGDQIGLRVPVRQASLGDRRRWLQAAEQMLAEAAGEVR